MENKTCARFDQNENTLEHVVVECLIWWERFKKCLLMDH